MTSRIFWAATLFGPNSHVSTQDAGPRCQRGTFKHDSDSEQCAKEKAGTDWPSASVWARRSMPTSAQARCVWRRRWGRPTRTGIIPFNASGDADRCALRHDIHNPNQADSIEYLINSKMIASFLRTRTGLGGSCRSKARVGSFSASEAGGGGCAGAGRVFGVQV